MARVKKGVNAHKRHKKILKLAKGFYGAKSKVFRAANPAVKSSSFRIRRQKVKEETVQTDVDRENQRGCENERYQLQQTDGRSQKVRYRNQQKDAFRNGNLRRAGIRSTLRNREEGSKINSLQTKRK